MTALRLVLVLAALASALPSLASASDPRGSNFWSDVRRPRGPEARVLSRRAELRLFVSRDASPILRLEWVRAAHIELNRAFILAPDDLDVAYFRARAALEEALLPITRDPKSMSRLAISRFDALRDLDPEHRAEMVAFDLAILHTRLGDYERAAEEYRRARAALLDPRFGGTIVSNLAEITMLSGDLERAAVYFEEAIEMSERLSGNRLSLVLALIGGAVAFDRLGDGARAMELAMRARIIEGGTIRATREPGVFFEPAEEIHYYDAIDALAWATQAQEDEERERALKKAESSLARFLELGESTSRFTARAKARLAEVRRRLSPEARLRTRRSP
jgi:tetratricopeptide (TPR) repeat protein